MYIITLVLDAKIPQSSPHIHTSRSFFKQTSFGTKGWHSTASDMRGNCGLAASTSTSRHLSLLIQEPLPTSNSCLICLRLYWTPRWSMFVVARRLTHRITPSFVRRSTSKPIACSSQPLFLPSLHLGITRTMASQSLPKTMRGIIQEKTGGTEVLQYRTDLPVPIPKEGEVLIKNEYIGINYIDT